MRVAIMQPTYWPWSGYFNLIHNADVFVFLDDVQFERKSWQQRNRIIRSDKMAWLTVPVLSSGNLEQRILDVEIDNSQPWRQSHLKAIHGAYAGAPHAAELAGLTTIYDQPIDSLAALNMDIIARVLGLMGLEREIVTSSKLAVSGRRSDRLLAICERLGATEYLSPAGSRDYIEQDGVFARAGLPVTFQSYRPEIYRHSAPLHAGDFPSILDALAHVGPSRTREMIERDMS